MFSLKGNEGLIVTVLILILMVGLIIYRMAMGS